MKVELNKLLRPNIRNLDPYVCARQNSASFSGAKCPILLDANENPNPPFNRYPDPLARDLKKALAKYLVMESENICVGNGSDELIDLTIRIFCEPGVENIVSIDPTYGVYKVCADINNVEYRKVALTEKLQIDVEAMLEKVDENTKLIFICSPNNPTANVMRDSDILDICARFEGIVVVDEAYIEFADKKSLVTKIKKYPNLIVLRTLSKAFGKATIRVGYAVAERTVIEVFNKVKPSYNVSGTSQAIAIKALQNIEKMKKQVEEILTERRRIIEEIEKMGIAVMDSDANFILVKVANASDIQKKIEADGIIVRDRSECARIEGCLRISIGKRRENDEFLRSLKRCLSNNTSLKKAVAFVDRDGVILDEPQTDFQVDSLEKYRILPGVIEALAKLKGAGYLLVMVSNQNGIGTENFPEENFLIPQNKLIEELDAAGVAFDQIFVCPHLPEDQCECRKPKIGLVKDFLTQTPINYESSFMIGDRETDLEFAKNIGVKGIKIETNSSGLANFVNQLIP